jgi:hypothetical protein
MMDRTLATALVIFVGLAVAGVLLIVGGPSLASRASDAEALRLVGTAMLGAGLGALLVEALESDRSRRI